MLYRIRYRAAGTTEQQAQVEAASPTEAMLKFCCTQATAPQSRRDVVSVQADDDEAEGGCPSW
jgi:hypothetical protein